MIALACQPSTSVAAVAMANGLNANMLRRWGREVEAAGGCAAQLARPREGVAAAFVQLLMPEAAPEQTAPPAAPRVELEIQRNGATVRASLPLDNHSATWLREVTG